jgi:hypothetical protein
MTEQIIEVVRGKADVTPTRSDAVPTATIPTTATEGARIGETQFRIVRRDKSLAERVSEAYKGGLEPKEKELLDRAAEQLGRRLSGEK